MKDDRIGDHLWQEWSFDTEELGESDSLFYYTVGHVDLEEELVRRALASSLQRDGIVDTLSQGYSAAESSLLSQGYSGVLEEESDLYVCNEAGETFYGDYVEDPVETTWVELSSNFQQN